jgi:hypothetical protein
MESSTRRTLYEFIIVAIGIISVAIGILPDSYVIWEIKIIFILGLLVTLTIGIILWITLKEVPDEKHQLELKKLELIRRQNTLKRKMKELENEDLRNYFYQDIKFNRYVKRFEILENGAAIVTYDLIVTNVSDKIISKIYLPKASVDTYGKEILDLKEFEIEKLLELRMGDKEIEIPLKALYSFKEYFPYPTIQNRPSNGHIDYVYGIPLSSDTCLKPNEKRHLLLKTHFLFGFNDMYNGEFAGNRVNEVRELSEIQIIAPPEYKINLCCDESTQGRGYIVLNFLREKIEEDIIITLEPPRVSKDKKRIIWTVNKPKIGLAYAVKFKIEKSNEN